MMQRRAASRTRVLSTSHIPEYCNGIIALTSAWNPTKIYYYYLKEHFFFPMIVGPSFKFCLTVQTWDPEYDDLISLSESSQRDQ